MKRLIVLRGNSGSGKTTVARLLQEKLKHSRTTMLLSQDTLRREILHVKEDMNHPTAEMAQLLTRFGWEHGFETVIIEGIWGKQKNGQAIIQLIDEADQAAVYYFDISFAETLRRHATKPNAQEFGEVEMKQWWKEKDVLGLPEEQLLSEQMSIDDIIKKVLRDVALNKEEL